MNTDVERVRELLSPYFQPNKMPRIRANKHGFVDLYFPQLFNGSTFNGPALDTVRRIDGLKVIGAASDGPWSLIGVELS